MTQLSSTTTSVVTPPALMKITMQQVIRLSLLFLFLSLLTFLYWILYGSPQAGIDDSDIYFTYVKNLVNGHGFVFYPGGERVEGFTSLLWVLLCSVFYLIDPQNYPQLILGFNVVLITFALFMCCNFIRTLARSEAIITPAEILFLAMLCLVPGYIDWTILTLMETGLWSLLLIITGISICVFDVRSRTDTLLLSILLALQIIVRPESYMWSMVFALLIFFKALAWQRKFSTALKIVRLPLAFILLTIAGLTAFRLAYFGFPLPNTYYAKVSSDKIYNLIEGVRYYVNAAIQSPALILVSLAAVVSWTVSARALYRDFRNKSTSADIMWIQFTLSTITLISLALPAYTGGDHFKLLRFYQPFFPLYLLLFFNFAFWKQFFRTELAFGGAYRYFAVIALIPFIYLVTRTPLHTYRKGLSPLDWEFRLSELGRDDANKMNAMFGRLGSLPRIGVCTAGGFGYAYNGPVIDLMGLNNVRMAHATDIRIGFKNHAAFDINTFYELQPDIFHGYFRISSFVDDVKHNTLYENDPTFHASFTSGLYKGMFSDKKFRQLYKPVLIEDPESKLVLKTYVKTGFIPKLVEHGYIIHENFWMNPITQPSLVNEPLHHASSSLSN